MPKLPCRMLFRYCRYWLITLCLVPTPNWASRDLMVPAVIWPCSRARSASTRVPGVRDVVEAGDGDSARHVDAVPHQRVDDAERGLVVRAGDRLGQGVPAGQEVLDHPGTARRGVVPLPRGPAHEPRAVGGDLLL